MLKSANTIWKYLVKLRYTLEVNGLYHEQEIIISLGSIEWSWLEDDEIYKEIMKEKKPMLAGFTLTKSERMSGLMIENEHIIKELEVAHGL